MLQEGLYETVVVRTLLHDSRGRAESVVEVSIGGCADVAQVGDTHYVGKGFPETQEFGLKGRS